jgi:DNA-binding MarR family transcriptional regulator
VGPKHVRQTDYRDLAEFRYQLRRYLRFSEAAAREAGVEAQQHQLLLVLKGLPEHEEPTVRTLAERLQIQHQSAVGLVDRSVERGLVRRQRGADDRRTVRVELTPEGDRILASLSEAHQAELTSAAPALIRALYGLLSGGMDNEALDELVAASAHVGERTQG